MKRTGDDSAALGRAETPAALLGYQQRAIRAVMLDSVVVVEKSRRIGLTWGLAAEAVLTASRARAAGGMKVFYVGYNLDMAREFIDACAMWAKAVDGIVAEVGETLFLEDSEHGETRSIKAFRIEFASGFEIVALCSAPRSLRGKQGMVIIDEAAFHDALSELLKSALALLMWGGRVVVVSTHDGIENPFNQLVEDCRNGRKPYGLVRITFEDAVRDGLFRRICLVRGQEWSEEAERAWVDSIRASYGTDAEEELDCVPKRSGGKWLSSTLLLARSTNVPIVRWSCDDEFAQRPEEVRREAARVFCVEHLEPILLGLPDVASFLGSDFARSGDLSVTIPLLEDGDVATPALVLEMRNVPFTQQEEILVFLVKRLPSFRGGALDGRGNGQMIAERATQRWGSTVECVMLSEKWYRDHAPKVKADLEDARLVVPDDPDTLDDLRSVELVRGVPRVPEKARKTKGGQRHGDAAIALMLADYARHVLNGGPIDMLVDDEPTDTQLALAGGDSLGGTRPGGWIL